jgi:hypothetical protein
MYTHATIKELSSPSRRGKHIYIIEELLGNGVFYVVRAEIRAG